MKYKHNQILSAVLVLVGATVFAVEARCEGKHDGSTLPACQGVVDKCLTAPVSAVDSRTGATVNGYTPGEHKYDHHGLWVDCVGQLAKSKPVEGVTGVSAASAQACLAAEKAAHPGRKAVTK